MTSFSSLLFRAAELIRNYPGPSSFVAGMVIGVGIELNRQVANPMLIPVYGLIAYRVEQLSRVTQVTVRGVHHLYNRQAPLNGALPAIRYRRAYGQMVSSPAA